MSNCLRLYQRENLGIGQDFLITLAHAKSGEGEGGKGKGKREGGKGEGKLFYNIATRKVMEQMLQA